MPKVAIIIPYFGEFPKWFNLYLFSCSKNPFIDFLFFTDCTPPERIYANTKFHKISFEEYCLQISSTLGIKFFPNHAYKLCDVKPFYGYIHKKELISYDYWGFGDIDLIYGDLSILLNNRDLKRYDLITTHADRVAGHFTVIRKDSPYTEACFQIKDWKKKLESNQIFIVDEQDLTNLVHPFMRWLLKLYGVIRRYTEIDLYSFLKYPNIITNLFTSHKLKEYYTTPRPKPNQVWKYDLSTNKIMDPFHRDLPYLHFLFFKKTSYWEENKNYWKDDFWQIGNKPYEEMYGCITIDQRRITLLEKANASNHN